MVRDTFTKRARVGNSALSTAGSFGSHVGIASSQQDFVGARAMTLDRAVSVTSSNLSS